MDANPSVNLQAIHKKQSWTLAVAIILFVLALGWGIMSGLKLGRDKANLQNVGAIYDALGYFHSDQDRYPSNEEYDNQKILVPYYLSAMPVPPNQKGSCKDFSDYVYQQNTDQSYSLQFCLNGSVNGWNKGVNTLQNGQ